MKIPCPSIKLSPEEMLAYFRSNKDWRPGKEIIDPKRGQEALDALRGVQSTRSGVEGAGGSEEVKAQLAKAKAEHDRRVAMYKKIEDDPEMLGKKLKREGMHYAAEKRRITGDLTFNERENAKSREASNYIGKKVEVDGKKGEIVGHPAYGRHPIRFEDGTKKNVLAEDIEPQEKSKGSESAEKQSPQKRITRRYEIKDRGDSVDPRKRYAVLGYETPLNGDGTLGREEPAKIFSYHPSQEAAQERATEIRSYAVYEDRSVPKAVAQFALDALREKHGGFKNVEILSLAEAQEIPELQAKNRQGVYHDSRMYIIHDNIDVTQGDIDRSKKFGGTPEAQAAFRVIAHENIHHLVDFIRKDSELKKDYDELTSQIKDSHLDTYRKRGLIKDEDWERAREEFVALWGQSRMFREALKKENPGLFQKIWDFFKKVYAKLMGVSHKPDAITDDDLISLLYSAHEATKDLDPEKLETPEWAQKKMQEIADNIRLMQSNFKKRAPEEAQDLESKRDSLFWAGKAAKDSGMTQAESSEPQKGETGNFPLAPEEPKDPSSIMDEAFWALRANEEGKQKPESRGAEKSEEPAGPRGRKRTEDKERPLVLDAETGEEVEKVAKAKKKQYQTLEYNEQGQPIDENGAPAEDPRKTEEKIFTDFDFKKAKPVQQDYESFIASAPSHLVRLDQYLGGKSATYDVSQPLAPMVHFVRELMGYHESEPGEAAVRLTADGKPEGINVVTPERTKDVMRLMGRLLGKTGRGVEDYQKLFRESRHAKDGQGRVIHQGDAVAGVLQMEGLKYLEHVWQDMAMDAAQKGGRYSNKERKAIWDFSKAMGRYANKVVLDKYATISSMARGLQVRSAVAKGRRMQQASSILWDSLHANEAGMREAAEMEVGNAQKTRQAEEGGSMENLAPSIRKEFWEGELEEIIKKRPANPTKEQKRLLDLFDLMDEDHFTEESAASNSGQEMARDVIEEQQQSAKGSDDSIRSASKAASDINKDIISQKKNPESKGAAKRNKLSEQTPEELQASLKRAIGRVKDLLQKTKETSVSKEKRKGWFDGIRDLTKDDPELQKLIDDFEAKEAIRDKQDVLHQDIKEQIKNPVSKEQFSAELQSKHGLSKDMADRQAALAEARSKAIKAEREERAKNKNASNPEKLIRSKAFINSMMDSIFAAPEELRSNPQWREDNILQNLMEHGMSPDQAQKAAEAFGEHLHYAWEQANRQAIAKVYKMLGRKGPPSYDVLKAAARVGFFDPGNPVMAALAAERGFKGISPEDNLKLGMLDWKMSWHDPRMKSKYERDWYRILAAAGMPKTALQIATQSFVSNALSGMTTMGLHWLSPAYITMRLVGLDMLRSGVESKGNLAETFGRWHASMDAMIDSYKNTLDEAKFALKYDTTSEGIEVLNSAYSMEQDHNKAKEDIQKALKEGNRLALLGATTRYVATSTDIVRRILASGFQTWGSNMHDFVLQSEAMRELTQKAGMSAKEAHALLESAVAEAPGLVDEMIRSHGEKPEDYTPLELSAMQRDKAAQRMATVAAEMISPEDSEAKYKDLMDTAKGGFQTEQGTYQGENSPVWDVPTQLTEMVKSAAQAMRKKNELLGRIMMGFLTVPANVVNRSFYFTPLGILRALGKQKGWKGFDDYYQTTQKTQALTQMRMAEGVVGSIGMALIASLMLNEDKDKPVFNVTGSGPKDKNLRDAWEKQGHHTNSVELQVGDNIVAIPYGRAGLEGMQIPMAALGALDDAKLNSSADPKKAELLGRYAHYAYTNLIHEMGSVATGGGLSGSITGSDIRNSAFWSMKAAAFVPYSSAIRSAMRLIAGPLDQSSIGAAIASQQPYLMPFGKPALNVLGDPISSKPLDLFAGTSEKLYGQGVPIFLGIPKDSSDANIYRLFQSQGASATAPSYTKMNHDYNMTIDGYQRFLISRGQIIKSAVRSNMAPLRAMSEDSFKKALTKIDSDATSQTVEKMRLTKFSNSVK